MPAAEPLHFFTIGHSSHTSARFLELLRQHQIEVVVDTRSAPYSRFVPHFNRETLKLAVTSAGMRYVWMGDVIGGRPGDSSCYDAQGHVLYDRVAGLTHISSRDRTHRARRRAVPHRASLRGRRPFALPPQTADYTRTGQPGTNCSAHPRRRLIATRS